MPCACQEMLLTHLFLEPLGFPLDKAKVSLLVHLSLYCCSLNNDLEWVWPCFSFTLPNQLGFLTGKTVQLFMHMYCMYAGSFVPAGAHMSIHLFVNTVSVLSCASDSKDDEKLLCTCENDKGTCVNGTCQGDICFYTWVHGHEERGCFFKVNYREQCFTSFARFYVYCCTQNQCNTFATPPPNISQYPKPLLYNILMSHL